jgi:seryl-tRNA synthetase
MPQVLLKKWCNWTKSRATQVELDGILSESNKLSKDIGEMMKAGEKSKAAILKENSFIKEKKKEISRNSRCHAQELLEKLYSLPNLQLILFLAEKRQRKTLMFLKKALFLFC